MNVNELMIGDWVQPPDSVGRVVSIAKIKAIDSYAVMTNVGGPWLFDEIDPIPLTPEILDKNGFGYVLKVKEWAHFYLGKEHCENANYHIGTNNRGIYWLNTGRNSIYGLQFVHELQHALRLCGIENEIEL